MAKGLHQQFIVKVLNIDEGHKCLPFCRIPLIFPCFMSLTFLFSFINPNVCPPSGGVVVSNLLLMVACFQLVMNEKRISSVLPAAGKKATSLVCQ